MRAIPAEGSTAGWPAAALALGLLGLYVMSRELAGGAGERDPVYRAWIAGARIPELVAAGQWWRLSSAASAHASLEHLLTNAIGVAWLGWVLARLAGWPRAITVLVLTGVGAHAAGALLTPGWSLGASGGVFGLLGAVLGLAWRDRGRLPPAARRLVTVGALPWLLILLAVAFQHAGPAADHLAHGAGLLLGGALGLAWLRLGRPSGVTARLGCALALSLALVGPALAWRAALEPSLGPLDAEGCFADSVVRLCPVGAEPDPVAARARAGWRPLASAGGAPSLPGLEDPRPFEARRDPALRGLMYLGPDGGVWVELRAVLVDSERLRRLLDAFFDRRGGSS